MSRIVLIAAATEGYRRGGLKFGKEPMKVDLDELDDGPSVAIETDPNLTIKPLEMTADCSECQARVEALVEENAALKAELSEFKQEPVPLSLADAIRKLDPDNSEHFTKGGKPEVKAIEALMGTQISAAERDDVWATIQEAKAQLEA